ncbi:unnamed protein product [Amaranthus hypochondriacus]
MADEDKNEIVQSTERKNRSKLDHNLPPELLIEILKRLPVTSLVRFMSVCKFWYSLITNPSFISTHLSHQSDPTSKNGITTLYSTQLHHFLHNLNEPLENWSEIHSPIGNVSLIVGCCNGIICLYADLLRGFDPLILWNPSIRKGFNLPLPIAPFRFQNGNCSYGFGFDSISNEYKVVRIICKWEMEKNTTFLYFDFCSLSKSDWKNVVSCIEGGKFLVDCRGVHVNGVIHWVVKKIIDDNVVVKTILAFNLATEELSEMFLPNPFSTAVLFSVKLDEDKLAVSSKGDENNVWVMEKYGVHESWKKLLEFHLGDNVGTILGTIVAENGKIVVTTSVGNWISWDPSNSKLKNLALPVLNPNYVHTYVQSLVLFNFENRALKCRPLKKKVMKRLTAREYRKLF